MIQRQQSGLFSSLLARFRVGPLARAIMRVPGGFRKAAVPVLIGAVLAACGTSGYEPRRPLPPIAQTPQTAPQTPPQVRQAWGERPEFIMPKHMAGKTPIRVALLLPEGAADEAVRNVAKGMRDSAELALFQINVPNLLLVVEDTKGTAQGAARAARRAIDQGAELILGPLFAESVSSVAPVAQERGIPVVAFSTDRAVGGNGVFLLSFQVEEEVRRVVEFAMLQEMTGFAALVPDDAYGSKVANTLQQQAYLYNAEIRHLVKYNPYADDLRADVKSIAEYGQRRAALESQVTVLNSMDDDQAALRALERLKDTDGYGLVSYQAVLLPAGGSKLRRLAPLLPYFDIDNKAVKFLGTGLWDDPALWNEPSLQGGWFAAPTPEVRSIFNDLFERNFGYQPPRLASLAYDAVTLAAALSADGAAGRRFTAERIASPSGFTGIDGLFRFLPSGGAERGLAILEVKNGSVDVVGPAPTSFAAIPRMDPFAPDGAYLRPGDTSDASGTTRPRVRVQVGY